MTEQQDQGSNIEGVDDTLLRGILNDAEVGSVTRELLEIIDSLASELQGVQIDSGKFGGIPEHLATVVKTCEVAGIYLNIDNMLLVK